MLNQIIMMGRMVDEPVLRTTSTGVKVAVFRIACDRDRQIEGGQKADFVDCVAWRTTGEFVHRYFNKGKPIVVSGRLQIRPYETKDGQKRKATEILVEHAEFCGGEKFDRAQTVVPVPGPAEVEGSFVAPSGPSPFEEFTQNMEGELPF